MAQRIKIKQLTSGSQPYGKILTADGNSGFTFTDGGGILSGSTFPSSPEGGTIFYRTDLEQLYHYDDSRSKWLTVTTSLYNCGRGTIQKNVSAYMYVGTAAQSSTEGFYMKQNGTIIAVSIDNGNTMGSNRLIEVRVNNSTTNRVQMTMTTGTKSVSTDTANQDFSEGDIMQVIGVSNGGTDFTNINVVIEVAWRA